MNNELTCTGSSQFFRSNIDKLQIKEWSAPRERLLMKSPRWGRCSGSSLMMLHSSYSVHYHNTLWRSKLANRRQWATSYYTKDVTSPFQQYLDVKLNINKAGFFLSTLIFAQSFRLGFLLIHFFSAKKVRDNQLMKANRLPSSYWTPSKTAAYNTCESVA